MSENKDIKEIVVKITPDIQKQINENVNSLDAKFTISDIKEVRYNKDKIDKIIDMIKERISIVDSNSEEFTYMTPPELFYISRDRKSVYAKLLVEIERIRDE